MDVVQYFYNSNKKTFLLIGFSACIKSCWKITSNEAENLAYNYILIETIVSAIVAMCKVHENSCSIKFAYSHYIFFLKDHKMHFN